MLRTQYSASVTPDVKAARSRRPLYLVEAEGFEIERRERFGLGLVQRMAAQKPAAL